MRIEMDKIYCGDSLQVLQTLPENAVDCCVTSPPYYALRDYGADGQIGREATPEEYVSRITAVFHEVKRVLTPEGTCWLNIADTYCGTGSKADHQDPKYPKGRNGQQVAFNHRAPGCKPKDLIGIPWLVALALRGDGWYLRSSIIWHKTNPMPESTRDRPTRCYEFTAKGRTTLCEGWREIERLSRAASGEQDEDAEPEAVLPPLAEGQTFDNPAAEISERYTQPPKAFTEDTLLSAMESAGKEDTPEDAERKGLGTTATRAGIIEKLISAGFAERKGKKLIPTKDGYNLVAILPDSLTSPQLTAEWETRLTGIAKGSDSPADFMRGIEEMTAGLVKTYSAISEDKAKLFTPQREAIGTCPRCGAAVYEGKKNFYCSDRACSFVMWKNDRFFEQRKKAFTKAIAAALLKDGKVKIKGMYSTKTGKTFDGVVLLADTGGKYVNFRVEQNRK